MRKRRQSYKPQANINVTSLLDITFVLLISFMIVAPALNNGVELKLPKVSKAQSINKEKPIIVSLRPTAEGSEIFVDKQAVLLDDLVGQLQENQSSEEPRAVAFRADRSVEWEEVAQVIAALKDAGVDNLGIMTEVADS